MSDLIIDPARLPEITLTAGSHRTRDEGLCLMEAVAFLAGEKHTDQPKCVSPVLAAMWRGLNDCLPTPRRQELLALIPSLPGTADDGHDEARSYMALDWLIRTWLPTWLDLVPACREDAARVRDLGRIVDQVSAERAGPVVREAGKTSAAAWAAAGAAAGAVAWAVAWAAAGAAAGAVAWAAARDAAGAAARGAAGAAARDAAGDAAGAAAGAAARDVLAPTVEALQESAVTLYAEMITAPWALAEMRATPAALAGSGTPQPEEQP